MSCDQYSDIIVELVDGTKPDDELRHLRAHLESCAACRALVADLRQIRDVARTLEPMAPPPAVWSRIAREVDAARTGGTERPWFQQPRWLALAAALVLAVGSVAILWRAMPASGPASPEPTTVAGNAPVGDIVQRIEEDLRMAEAHYQSALTDLERIAAAEGSGLDPAVTSALRSNVALVDQAIADSRAALDTDPQSAPARESLFDALRRKVVLLQETIALVSEMSRGNQAGAAQIVEGLKKS